MDIHDRIIGKSTRSEIHKNNLLHRSIHILVFNFKGQIFLQKRSMSKDENPGLWDISCAGHVNSGESYDECANRELREELGIKAALNPLTKIEACNETYHEHVQVYFCKTGETIKINQAESSEGKYLDFRTLKNETQKKPDQFTLSLKLILKKYTEKIIKDAQILL